MVIRDITFPSADGHLMRAALAMPELPSRYPGIIVIHEIFGLNDEIRRIASKFSELGYVALAPDLYDGSGPRIICITQTLRALSRKEGAAFADLDAARRFLCAQPEVDESKVGVIGFCMGGGFALLYAVRAPLNAAAVFYGSVPKTVDELRGVCPVLGSYGGRDQSFASQGERLEIMLTELGVTHDVKIYPDAGHGFMCMYDGMLGAIAAWGPIKVGYNQPAAEDSWQRIEKFFGEHLKSG